MRNHLQVVLALAALTAASAAVEAQDRLPLQFAQASPELTSRLAADWARFSRRGQEWAYCVTGWSEGVTAAGDTVFVAERAALVEATAGNAAHVGGFRCSDKAGKPLPVIHAHLLGDCSPSRADIEHAESRDTWGLIVCGPRAVTGYSGRIYRLVTTVCTPRPRRATTARQRATATWSGQSRIRERPAPTVGI